MKQSIGLFQEQSLKLAMTQELKQAITLLQYSTLELVDFLKEQSMENPLMELKEPANIRELASSRKQIVKGPTSQTFSIENFSKHGETLHQYLEQQLLESTLSNEEKQFTKRVIPYIDPNGYIPEDYSIIAKQLNSSMESIENIIRIIKQMEPAGIGAKDLQECLLLQLQRHPDRNELTERILENDFTLFAEKAWKTLAKKYSITLKEIQSIHDEIVKLHPRPGNKFDTVEKPKYITPDLLVQRQHNQFIVSLNEEIIPQLAINKQYKETLKGKGELESYLQEKIQQCQWIVKSIEHRKHTLVKVMEEIVFSQQSFFFNGPAFLKPLTLKDIASRLNIHESTVSRATKEKYVQTQYGLFELKYFFSQGLSAQFDEEKSTRHVQQLIEELVKKEDKQKPLSDQQLTNLLQGEYHISISRRTVAKYRDLLQIPSSSMRKRYD
ncbi:RNA polymerase factor sigma-54 [Sutcliffiella rhizosphaerae]|uniref:RNA polymerase sigma-54 factor n=1 Tax=Sutcliffiella rhizosphaerae TaxID=2880967 RepID=A0ABM8YLA7_9BACI|nr:RNA polymerase factor sigma-54 [Sutcliffiella rhizosphaerae]CAG9620718.1 RNA polymerase sigma-54 factor [Sutcliffiella rhizosphaerae]